ncbi:MAG: DUF3955 domain-containing protein [Vagococcus sp.]|uniref:DUF3955 domain-containing protein n=1 Tax=Vagococcus sp. TaxID=1933889 RepID=UPI002FC84D76
MISKNKGVTMFKTTTVFFAISVFCFVIKALIPTTVDSNGFLNEPFFFLIPMGYLFLFLSLLIGVLTLVIKLTKKIN